MSKLGYFNLNSKYRRERPKNGELRGGQYRACLRPLISAQTPSPLLRAKAALLRLVAVTGSGGKK
jgi:hypothetical protein